jgi:thiosulfate dehydrogenase
MTSTPDHGPQLARLARLLLLIVAGVVLLVPWVLSLHYRPARPTASEAQATEATDGPPPPGSYHRPAIAAPDTATIPATTLGQDIRYGRALVARTAQYLGPSGTVGHFTNGMNCQNCHLDAGTRGFANNYLAVAATYPKLRARSGTVESIDKRVTDCVERSLNGRALPPGSRERHAFVAYLTWLGQGIAKGKKVYGTGLTKLAYLDRAANPTVGRSVYAAKCQSCHGPAGQGQPLPNGHGYQYPPLWGPSSYTDAAGLYRLSSLARYVKAAMPYGATFDRPQLTDAQAWDVAAFINSQPRPHRPTPHDWPDLRQKPIDHPFGPYADSFSEHQHKYGPFQPIADAHPALAH